MMTYDSYELLSFSRQGRVLTLSFNLPEKLNAVDARMHTELAHVFQNIAKDKDTDVVILTGAGKAFSAGGDIGWMQSMLPQPAGMTMIAPEGRATLALFCDIIIADETARIADPHVRVGLVAGDGGPLDQSIGQSGTETTAWQRV